MSEFCTRTRLYANLHRLQYCTGRDEHTAYDPDEKCLRCKRCGERTTPCKTCASPVHWTESSCARCGNDPHRRTGKENTSSSALVPPSSMEDAILEFFHLLPFKAAKAAYRVAIQELHPDRGGDTFKAARLNAAWQRIKAEMFEH